MKKHHTTYHKICCVLISCQMLLLAGCGVDDAANGILNGISDKTSNEAVIDIPSHITKQLNKNLQVDAKVSTAIDVSGTLYSYQSVSANIKGPKLKELFFKGDEDVAMDETEGQTVCRSVDDTKRASWVKDLYTSFSDMKDIRYLAVIWAYGADSAFPETLCTAEALPFMSASDAQALVKETAGRLGITLADEPYAFFALDESVLTDMYRQAAAKLSEDTVQSYLPKSGFTGDKGCYYMLWQQLCPHGETMMSGNVGLNVKGFTVTMGTYVMAIVNEDGLVSFRAGNSYDCKNERMITDMMDADAALDKIGELYQTVPLEGQYCITDITLQYVAVLEDREAGSYRLVPAWCMETSEENYRLFVVDALKGILL